MIVTEWSNAGVALGNRRCGAALGVFDGVHRGHLDLIGRVVAEPEILPVVVTFRNHPASLLAPTKTPALLMTLRQRIEAFESVGVGACVLIDFTATFRRLSGVAFLSELSEKMDLSKLVVGFNFRCGHNMQYGPPEIEAFFSRTPTQVAVASAVTLDGESVSSSRLRRILSKGDLAEFARISGREFAMDFRGLLMEERGLTERVEVSGDRLSATGQAVPAPGRYRAIGVDSDGTEIDLVVTSNYLEGPVAASSSLLYIVRN